MKIEFYKKNGEKDTPVEYPKNLVSEVSDARLLEYVRMVRANMRANNAKVKDRSEVSGGGKKPWKQKGTGRARVGSSRSPIWSGGGVTFGPTNERNYTIKLNKKEKRAALLAAIYSKVSDKKAIGVSDLKFAAPKTSDAAKTLEKLPINGKVMVFVPAADENAKKSFQNIPAVTLAVANTIDIISVISADSILFSKESLTELDKHFSPKIVTKEVASE
ncbi:MAG: 50S ribosomal protein L4 [Candidatus Berkelbacteria bacterium]